VVRDGGLRPGAHYQDFLRHWPGLAQKRLLVRGGNLVLTQDYLDNNLASLQSRL